MILQERITYRLEPACQRKGERGLPNFHLFRPEFIRCHCERLGCDMNILTSSFVCYKNQWKWEICHIESYHWGGGKSEDSAKGDRLSYAHNRSRNCRRHSVR